METGGSKPTIGDTGPDFWMRVCLDAGFDETALRKMPAVELYLLAGKVLDDRRRNVHRGLMDIGQVEGYHLIDTSIPRMATPTTITNTVNRVIRRESAGFLAVR